MRILVVDHYDSFTNSLLSLLQQISPALQLEKCFYKDIHPNVAADFDVLILSAGPGEPKNYPKSNALIQNCKNVLGVCLGMQMLTVAMGGKCLQSSYGMHGMRESIYHNRQLFLQNFPSPFFCARYNSLVCVPSKFFTVLAQDEKNQPMILYANFDEKIYIGIQFHPESFLSELHGPPLMKSILQIFAAKCSKSI